MPSNSKRNRRISQNRKTTVNSTNSTANITPAPVETAQPRPAPVYNRPAKSQPENTQVYTAFTKDLKWIGLVTGIIVILLIVAYYVVPH